MRYLAAFAVFMLLSLVETNSATAARYGFKCYWERSQQLPALRLRPRHAEQYLGYASRPLHATPLRSRQAHKSHRVH